MTINIKNRFYKKKVWLDFMQHPKYMELNKDCLVIKSNGSGK